MNSNNTPESISTGSDSFSPPYRDWAWADNCGAKEGSSSAIITEKYWEEENIPGL